MESELFPAESVTKILNPTIPSSSAPKNVCVAIKFSES